MRPYRKKRELANWVRRKLGSPVVDVLIDSTQLDDCIDQATDFFGEHAGGIGNEDSIILISPEQVYYDGTGNPTQPGPTRGKWRKPYPAYLNNFTDEERAALTPAQIAALAAACATPSPTSQPTTACCDVSGVSYDNANDKYGGDDGDVKTNFQIATNCCADEVAGPGTDWCGIGPQTPHCFTETNPGDPTACGPYWVVGDTTSKPMGNGYKFKTVYDVPRDVIAIQNRLTAGFLNATGNTEDNALFAPAGMLLQGGGSWGMQNSGQYTDSRWGFWMGSSGGFVDIVSWQMAMSYIEMFRQYFTIKMDAQLSVLEHKVRITPPPTDRGVIALECTRRVADDALYEHQWIRDYATAMALIQAGMNASKYEFSFPGGGKINGEMYLTRGDALREKLELQIAEGLYAEPPDFYVG